MSKRAIEPCIYCKNPNVRCRDNGKKQYVFCPNCRARGPEKKTSEEAIARYNAVFASPTEEPKNTEK